MTRSTKTPAGGAGGESADAGEGPRSRSPLAWYRWYPGDHLRVTRGWPLLARAVYRELLDAQWDLGILPAAPRRLRDLVAGITPAEWKAAWGQIAGQFPRCGHGRQNPALETLRSVQVALVEKRRRAGIAGNRVRWGHLSLVGSGDADE
jgi:hypothetical protein